MFERICCTYIHETPLAVLVDAGAGNVWIPKSVIEEVEPNWAPNSLIEINVATWFCEKEDLY